MSTVKNQPRDPRAESKRTFTIRLPLTILHELDRAAEETGLRKNEILIQAFTEWNAERKKAH